jgi:hypothetical protein
MENNKQTQDELVNALTKVYHDFSAHWKNSTNDQINEIPFEGSWTPGQVTDHIIKATGGIPDKIPSVQKDPLMKKLEKWNQCSWILKLNSSHRILLFQGNGPFEKKELTRTLQRILEKHKEKINNTDLKELCMVLNFRISVR